MYPWAYLPWLGGCALLAVIVGPRFERETRLLDVALCLILLAGVVQLVPLPSGVVKTVAPGVASLHSTLTLDGSRSTMPLSIDPRSTLQALAIVGAAVLLYWSARRTLASGGVRVTCQAIAWLGLLMGCGAIVQLAVSRGRIYGFWSPHEMGATPFGPFVNRNHAATWLVMALPVIFGYLLARLRPAPGARVRTQVRHALDARTVWLLGSATVMLVALAMSMSRSAIIAIATAATAAIVLSRSRFDSVRSAWAAGAVLVASLAVLQFADVIAVAGRFDESSQGPSGRMHIWRDTLLICRSLWPSGSGMGTFQDAMLVFQSGDRTYYFNHAHNHFLQVAAEGGVVLGVPTILALVGLAGAARVRMTAEVSGLMWIRGGAATGLLAAAVQSLWDTGLRMPANAALAAVLAAIVTHRPHGSVAADRTRWH